MSSGFQRRGAGALFVFRRAPGPGTQQEKGMMYHGVGHPHRRRWAGGLLGHLHEAVGGLHQALCTVLTFAGMAASFLLLARATRTLPLGTASAVWTGIGALGALIVGVIVFRESLTPAPLLFAALLLIGIIGLKATA